MAKSVNGGGGCADDADSETTPICRCRVLYLGSAVPHITKDGLQGIQEPLRDLYPEQGVFWNTDRDHVATGIDSWLSVWSNGILVENVDDKGNTVRRFHPIESLHYCAAVRYISMPFNLNDPKNCPTDQSKVAKFLPLDSPFSKNVGLDPMRSAHPPLFACILRRTSGIKVLECHAFICKKEAAANALVRCCFHAYADTMHAKQIELESPYEQLDKRRSRSIGSALDSQSLIDDKVNNWRKNSTGGSSSGSPDESNGFNEPRSISRQNHQTRTPSVASLISHSMTNLPNGAHAAPVHPPGPNEPIYYNGMQNGTLRSVRSFISLAALKSHSKKSARPRQMPIAMAGHPMPPPPPLANLQPVMFATLSKKELKKALKKESTLKRKHKYKDLPMPIIAPNGFPILYNTPIGQPPPLPAPIYAPLPSPPGPGPFYGTIDSRKGRYPLPPPNLVPPPSNIITTPDGDHFITPPMVGPHFDEPIYMPANEALHNLPPQSEPIYLETRPNGSIPMPIPISPSGPPIQFVPHPHMPGNLMPCTLVPTLSRKELKELEKQKALMKKVAKKEKKKSKQNSKKNLTNGDRNDDTVQDYFHPTPYGYPDEMNDGVHEDSAMIASEMQMSSGNYSNSSNSGGIYKKKGHLNERAFSYSIRQEHRSRSNSLSNLVFENGVGPGGLPPQPMQNGKPKLENDSHNASSVSLKSSDMSRMNGHHHHHGYNNHYPSQPQINGNGLDSLPQSSSTGSLQQNDPIANGLVQRMSNLNLKNGHLPNNAPPPPPLPVNGYGYGPHQQQQRTATIKRI
ncbi:hypothetical protein QR98_0034080 [Sarcoptes scabiei]|uniref:Uncharacterized protein n=1 Tax=Sarcoptes scabiei TaxID=52283 RepID=A0A132A1L8_SARSC|nr:hypothetical protein QR98_0034080 [Sarcoptes scabiei]